MKSSLISTRELEKYVKAEDNRFGNKVKKRNKNYTRKRERKTKQMKPRRE